MVSYVSFNIYNVMYMQLANFQGLFNTLANSLVIKQINSTYSESVI